MRDDRVVDLKQEPSAVLFLPRLDFGLSCFFEIESIFDRNRHLPGTLFQQSFVPWGEGRFFQADDAQDSNHFLLSYQRKGASRLNTLLYRVTHPRRREFLHIRKRADKHWLARSNSLALGSTLQRNQDAFVKRSPLDFLEIE